MYTTQEHSITGHFGCPVFEWKNCHFVFSSQIPDKHIEVKIIIFLNSMYTFKLGPYQFGIQVPIGPHCIYLIFQKRIPNLKKVRKHCQINCLFKFQRITATVNSVETKRLLMDLVRFFIYLMECYNTHEAGQYFFFLCSILLLLP